MLTSSNPGRISLAGVLGKTYTNDILIKQIIAKVENPSAKSLYLRDFNAKETDVFVEEDNVIHPLKNKKDSASDRRELKKYSVIDKTSLKHGNGGISYMCEEPILIHADNCFISK